MHTITLFISDMTCGGCANAVTKVLLALPGVVKAEVSHVEAKAEVSYDPGQVTPEQLKAAIANAGYGVTN
ncbi:MAG: heavy-metal-associated domain-containing protein [Methylophilaceae bacterium]